jgi:drug/metabolite transporter (DMT)-like permease
VKPKSITADLALLLATFFWGSSFIPVKSLVATIPPYELLAIRFGIVGIILLPVIIFRLKDKSFLEIFKSASILGILLFAGFSFQTVGMKYTTATNSAFVTGLNVVFVPIFLSLLGHHKPRLQLWICVLIAIIGLAIFSLQANWTINYGDFLVFFCAIVFSFHVIYTSRFTSLHDPIILTGIQFILVFIIGGIISVVTEHAQWVQPDFHGWMNILYLAIFATGISILLQANFQRFTETTRAALIYVMEPVFAAILGYLILSEHLTGRQWIGALLILSAMVFSEIKIGKSNE